MLLCLLRPLCVLCCRYAGQAHAVGQLCSEKWWLQRGAYIPSQPPEWVLQDMIRWVLQDVIRCDIGICCLVSIV